MSITPEAVTIPECLSIFHELAWATRGNDAERYRLALAAAQATGIDAETIRECWRAGVDLVAREPLFGPNGQAYGPGGETPEQQAL